MQAHPHVAGELAERGWSIIRGMLNPSEVEMLKAAFQSKIDRAERTSSEILYTHSEVPSESPGMSNLMTQWMNPHRSDGEGSTRGLASCIKQAIDSLFDEEPVLFQDFLMMKEPGHSPFEWHQDYPFWPIDSPQGVVVWIPVQDVNSENGGLGFADGSHRLGLGPSVNLHTGKPQQSSNGQIPAGLVAVTPDLKAGDAAIFTSLTWHRSDVNSSTEPRMAWSSIWLPSSSRWDVSRAPNHPLATELNHDEPVTGVPL